MKNKVQVEAPVNEKVYEVEVQVDEVVLNKITEGNGETTLDKVTNELNWLTESGIGVLSIKEKKDTSDSHWVAVYTGNGHYDDVVNVYPDKDIAMKDLKENHGAEFQYEEDANNTFVFFISGNDTQRIYMTKVQKFKSII